jgi:hypothetical protein
MQWKNGGSSLDEPPRVNLNPRNLQLLSRCGFPVVLLVVDLSAGVVLTPVDVFPFLRRKFAAVGRAIRCNVPVNFLLVIFSLRGFRWRHLSAGHTVGDPLLLQIAARPYFVVAVLRRVAVVFVVIDGMAHIILLPVHLPAFLRRQRAAVRGSVIVNFLV